MKDGRLAMMEALAQAQNGQKPRRRPGHEEHSLQVACVRLFRMLWPEMSHNLFAIPNGGWRNDGEAGKLKAEGVLPGVSDLILLRRNSFYGALCIEMKTAKGAQSERQKEWQSAIENDGYKYVVCRSVDDFQREIENYLKDNR